MAEYSQRSEIVFYNTVYDMVIFLVKLLHVNSDLFILTTKAHSKHSTSNGFIAGVSSWKFLF